MIRALQTKLRTFKLDKRGVSDATKTRKYASESVQPARQLTR